MKYKIFSILCLLCVISSVGFSASFDSNQLFIYNPSFEPTTALTTFTEYNGWECVGGTCKVSNEALYSNSHCSGDDMTAKQLLYGTIQDGTYNLKANYYHDSSYAIQYAGTLTFNFYNDEDALIETKTRSITGDYNGDYDLGNIDLNDSIEYMTIYLKSPAQCAAGGVDMDVRLNNFTIINSTTKDDYDFYSLEPEDDAISTHEAVLIDVNTGLINDEIKFYYLTDPLNDVNNGVVNFVDFTYLYSIDGGLFEDDEYKHVKIWGTQRNENVSNIDLRIINKDNNEIMISNYSVVRIDAIQNYELNYSMETSRFEIVFDVPTLQDGYDFNWYYIFLTNNEDNEMIRQYIFNDYEWSSGSKEFSNFIGFKAEGKIYMSSFNVFDLDLYEDNSITIKTSHEYNQMKDVNESTYDYRISRTGYDYYTLQYNSFDFYRTSGTKTEYASWDTTFDSNLTIFPTINDIDYVSWYVEKETEYGEVSTYYPYYYDGNFTLNLTRGVQTIRVKNSQGIVQKSAVITYYKFLNVLNQTLFNSYFEAECFSNDSVNTCDYNSMPSNFFISSVMTDFYNEDGTYTADLETDIYCEQNDTMTLFYSGIVESMNPDFVPDEQIDKYKGVGYEYYPIFLTFNPPFSETLQADLYDYLTNNADILNLNDWDFNQRIMSYYDSLTGGNRLYYVPKNVNCVLVQSYYTNQTNMETMNISFSSSTSLLDTIKGSEVYTDLRSSCYLNRFKTDAYGNPVNIGIIEYANYYSCVAVDFVSSNASTAYYIGFMVIAIILSRYLLDLFGVKKGK